MGKATEKKEESGETTPSHSKLANGIKKGLIGKLSH
jgi:hypothetical protein